MWSQKKIVYSLLVLALFVFVFVLMTRGVLNRKTAVSNLSGNILDNESLDTDINNKEKLATTNNSINRCIEQKPKALEVVSQPLRVVAVGDIMLGRGVEYHLDRLGKDYTYPFQNVADILRNGDVTFANLESPLTESTHGLDESGKIVLKSREKAAEGIKYAGFNILNLANNHIMDYYEEGLLDTMRVLDSNEIAYAGTGINIDAARKPAILEKNGLKIGIISYTDMAELTFKGKPMLSFVAAEEKSGVAPRKYELIKEDIDSIRDSVDIVIVSLHWGVENSFNVTEEQREFAYKLIDDGTDIILGHHPHRFQGVEVYKDKPIIYSLGNFIFDQNDPNNQESFIVNMNLVDKKLCSLELIPIRTIEKNHVIIPKGDEAKDMLKRELELCGKLGSKCAIVEDKIQFNIK